MSDEKTTKARRTIDRWLIVAISICTPIGILIGMLFRMGGAYQTIKDDHEKIANVISWKEKQEEFNSATTVAIARLQEITRRMQP